MAELRPRFVKVLDWARGAQAHILARQGSRKTALTHSADETMSDVEDAMKAVIVCNIMQSLIQEAPPTLAEEMILPL
eukprot:2773-Amphidinium_carterae.1